MVTPDPQLPQQAGTPQHYIPPTARELRGQVVHRLQVGLFGLAAMLLLAGLANIVMEKVRQSDSAAGAASGAAKPVVKNDALVDIGVAPQTGPSEAAKPAK